MKTKASAVVMVGRTQNEDSVEEFNAENNQILMMSTPNGEITGTHRSEHSFFLAEVEDDENTLTIKVDKRTLRSAREHYKECEKNGAIEGGDLNYYRWDTLIMSKIWAFVKH